MCNNEMLRSLDNEETMFLEGGAKSSNKIDTSFWNQWFSNLFEAFTS